MLSEQLTIVIPCKNEIGYLPNVLEILSKQEDIKGTRVIIADANSTDGTREYIQQNKFNGVLNIEMIEGGHVAAARNAGLQLVTTPLVLFLDADALLTHSAQLKKCVEIFNSKQLHLMGAPVNGKEPYTLYGLIF